MSTFGGRYRYSRRLPERTLAVILAGGEGSRLKNLTRWQSKPAVSFGGKFRTIDFSLSNCVNSGVRRISILTQYKSHSLNSHIQRGWHFLRPELGDFIELIPAQQRTKNTWYQGTADAVLQSLEIIEDHEPELVLILAGDHIYKMDYSALLHHHVRHQKDLTVAAIPVDISEARQFGVMQVDEHWIVEDFREKPLSPNAMPHRPDKALVSMGIYVTSTTMLKKILEEDAANDFSSNDFGKDILPKLVKDRRVAAYPFMDEEGNAAYWRDVGTIDAYFNANMDLLDITPQLNLYDQEWPIWTHQEQWPPAKYVFNDSARTGFATESLVSDGCIISGAHINHSVLSYDVRVDEFSLIEDCILMPGVKIGRNCKLRKAIVDKGTIIPDNTVIGYDADADGRRFYRSNDGIVVVTRELLGQKSPLVI